MTGSITRQLIAKDLYIHRRAILVYLAVGFLSVALLLFGGGGLGFLLGAILLIGVLSAGAIHIVMVSVIGERSDKTLSFVMSLPVSPAGYALAKIASASVMFLAIWLALAAAVLGTIYTTGFPDGWAPAASIILLQLVVTFAVILSAALVSESQGWTVAAIIASIIAMNILVPLVLRMPEVDQNLSGSTAVWTQGIVQILAVQLGLVATILGITTLLQARKTDFL